VKQWLVENYLIIFSSVLKNVQQKSAKEIFKEESKEDHFPPGGIL
jgi:hypothetical protein